MWYNILKTFAKICFFFIFRVKTYGLENEPQTGSYILCCNHISLMDPPLVGSYLKRQVHFMAKEEIFRWPLIGIFAKLAGAFPVNRDTVDLTAMKTALRILKNGEVLGIFPEGTRKTQDDDENAKGGIASFCYKTKCAILPAHIITKKGRVGLFTKIKIVYGKPKSYEDLGFTNGNPDEIKKISRQILKEIFTLTENEI